jgi:hypothetical protein
MALLAEETVEEWLNRQWYFTIRGIKLGVHEIDLLGIRQTSDGADKRHVEVQVSMRPPKQQCLHTRRIPPTGTADRTHVRSHGSE